MWRIENVGNTKLRLVTGIGSETLAYNSSSGVIMNAGGQEIDIDKPEQFVLHEFFRQAKLCGDKNDANLKEKAWGMYYPKVIDCSRPEIVWFYEIIKF